MFVHTWSAEKKSNKKRGTWSAILTIDNAGRLNSLLPGLAMLAISNKHNFCNNLFCKHPSAYLLIQSTYLLAC